MYLISTFITHYKIYNVQKHDPHFLNKCMPELLISRKPFRSISGVIKTNAFLPVIDGSLFRKHIYKT